jgi:hypothetical protein
VDSPLSVRKIDEPAQEQSSEGYSVGNQDQDNTHFRGNVVVNICQFYLSYPKVLVKGHEMRSNQRVATMLHEHLMPRERSVDKQWR